MKSKIKVQKSKPTIEGAGVQRRSTFFDNLIVFSNKNRRRNGIQRSQNYGCES